MPEPQSHVTVADILEDAEWQMTYGDRAALEGVLSWARPELAIEIGTAQGGSMRRIATHSSRLHSLDITFDLLEYERPANVTFHEGDSRELLPDLLERFAAEGRNVDFVLVDGDHRPEGVEADIRALLGSASVGRTVIMIHDSFHPWVRLGIERARVAEQRKVRHFEIDFTPGRMTLGAFDGELWGGFALLLVDDSGAGELPGIRIAHLDLDERLRTADAWETVVRAAPLVESIRAGEAVAQARPSLAARLRQRLRGARPGGE